MKTVLYLVFIICASDVYAQDTSRVVVRDEKTNKDSAAVSVWAEEMPQFDPSYGTMISYITKYINYPSTDVEGTGFYSFVVNENGAISEVKVLKAIPGCMQCDDEALRVIKSFPPFIPAKQNGKPVATRMVVPVKFTYK